MPTRTRLAAAAACAIVLAIYLPDVGHGFIKDDFRWIRASHVADAADVARLFATNVGFYRPLVSLTFAADYALWSLAPFGYGVTNLALFGADLWLLFTLAHRLTRAAGAALFAAAVWALNFHAVNMALLWVSGRTSLLVTLFSLATAHAVLQRRPALAGLFTLAAVLCKEEAVVLPVLFGVFLTLEAISDERGHAGRNAFRTVVMQCWPMCAALAVYAVLRTQSGAFGAFDAPSYYRFAFAPATVLRNIAEYADRCATTAAAAVVLLLAFSRGGERLAWTDGERRALLLAAVWVPSTYALTVFLPVRSSLYALLPSIGTALASGAVASRVARSRPAPFARAATALLVVAALLIPVYRSRNQRWVRLADLSSHVMTTIEEGGRPRGEVAPRIVLIENPSEEVTLDSVFGTIFPDAVALTLGEPSTGEIVQPGAAVPNGATQVYRLTGGRVTAAGNPP